MSSTIFKNKIFISFVTFAFILCLLISPTLSFKVSADSSTNFITMPLSQPSCGDTYGYFELLFEKPNGEYYPVVYQWAIDIGLTGDSEIPIPSYPQFICNLRPNYMSVNVSSVQSTEYTFHVILYSTASDGTYRRVRQSGSAALRVDFEYELVGYHFYGNTNVLALGFDSSSLYNNFTFNYLPSLDYISSNTGIIAEEISNLQSFFVDGYFSDYMYDVSGTLSNTYDLFNDFFNELSATDLTDYLSNISSYLYGIENDTFDILNLLDSDIYDVLSDILASQDNLVNGWEPTNPDGESKFPDTTNPDNNNTPELNGAINDLDNIESEIKGDKTPEDYRDEVGDILDKDKNNSVVEESTGVEPEEIDPEDITIVNQNVFNVVFQAFGGKFMTYFIMCLTLAFAAFVLGKRF